MVLLPIWIMHGNMYCRYVNVVIGIYDSIVTSICDCMLIGTCDTMIIVRLPFLGTQEAGGIH